MFAVEGPAGGGLSGMADNIRRSLKSFAQLVTAGAFLAGLGFALASILKFKAHKDNPTQIPIGTPIAMLFVAVALLFMPYLFRQAGKTVTGQTSGHGSISGVTSL